MTAIKKMEQVKKRILPRTLAFKDVLMCKKTEKEFEISDVSIDDFAMFRYEINSIFKNYQFKDEVNSEYINWNPLSKDRNGKQIREITEEKDKEKFQDMFRPPGLVKIKPHYYESDKRP